MYTTTLKVVCKKEHQTEVIRQLARLGIESSGISPSSYLNEWISITVPSTDDFKIIESLTPEKVVNIICMHQPIAEFANYKSDTYTGYGSDTQRITTSAYEYCHQNQKLHECYHKNPIHQASIDKAADAMMAQEAAKAASTRTFEQLRERIAFLERRPLLETGETGGHDKKCCVIS